MVEAKDVTVNVLTSAVTTLVIIFLLIPLLKIPVPAVREVETIETKKYYYPVPVVLEGDYSTWTEIAGSPLTFTTVAELTLVIVNEAGNFGVIHDNLNSKVALFVIDPPSITSEASNVNAPSSGGISVQGSILGKYIAYFDDTNLTSVKIYKNGVLIQTLNLSYSLAVGGLWVSQSGKYLFIMNQSLKQLHIYKGS